MTAGTDSRDRTAGVQPAPLLSVVAVSRNDDHGGNMRGRMQHFVDGFVAQCRRHGLDAELILVEWNPPPDRPPLNEILQWPADLGPASIRIVTVPQDVHTGFAQSSQLPLFQMIGKNVGIRRARGRFVLATNVDILLDDATVRYLRDRLVPGKMVRIDRYDVPSDLPEEVPFEQVLADCDKRFFYVNTRFGIFDVRQWQFLGMGTGFEASVLTLFTGLRILGIHRHAGRQHWLRVFANKAAGIAAAAAKRLTGIAKRYVRNVIPLRRLPTRTYYLARRIIVGVAKRISRLVRLGIGLATYLAGLLGLLGRTSAASLRFQRSRWLHTWACGDFTLLAKDDWFRLRGYPEWAMYSWHIDSAFMFAANAHDIREVALGSRYRAYHIDHSAGSGWSPHGGTLLFARLSAAGIRHLSDEDLRRWQQKVAERPTSAIVNDASWGLADSDLPERAIIPRATEFAQEASAISHMGAAV
jgi:hypothetical protein